MTSTPKIADVGGEDITPEQFQREFTRFLSQMERESQAKLSTTEAKALGSGPGSVGAHGDAQGVDEEGGGHRPLAFRTAQVISSLAAIPGLSDGKGGIDPAQLQRILQTE